MEEINFFQKSKEKEFTVGKWLKYRNVTSEKSISNGNNKNNVLHRIVAFAPLVVEAVRLTFFY